MSSHRCCQVCVWSLGVRKMSLIYAVDILMKSCRFCSWKPKPKQQVEQNRMWMESMIGFGIQCNTEGLQIDKAGLYTKIQSQMDNTKDFI